MLNENLARAPARALHRAVRDALSELQDSLAERPPRIPTRYLYDERGSELFERICELPEYYPTRTELAIMQAHVAEMAARLGPDVTLIEYGSGTSLKTRGLLAALERPRAYVPVDVSREPLEAAARAFAAEFPDVDVAPVCADFTQPFALPPQVAGGDAGGRRVVYFPGSTIGNFAEPQAIALLTGMAELIGADGAVLIGVDLRKDPEVLRAAYDDAQGVTAEFNLNILRHLNRELGTDFPLAQFRHAAPWNDAAGRIEMHLVATSPLRVHVGDRVLRLAAGDFLLTEYSHKYRPAEFTRLARAAGLRTRELWQDANGWFSVQLLEP